MEFIAQRKAILTEDHWSKRPKCHYCGGCMRGCCVDAKYTSANTPIPLALRTGNLTLISEAMMTRILMDSSGQRISGIEYTTTRNAVEKVKAKVLVLACPAHRQLETANLDLRTAQIAAGLGGATCQGPPEHLADVDFKALEAVGQSNFQQLALTTENPNSRRT
jgi:choline dehydrogenase-like flavoprotein